MKNKLLNFIDLLIFFFNQGYSLQETLDFCSLLNYEKEVKEIKNYLNQGFSLDEIFIMLPFPTLFKEYKYFFKKIGISNYIAYFLICFFYFYCFLLITTG